MQLHSITQTETRPDAMGDVPGICEIPLTRAVVQYRNLHETDASGGRIEDIGLALIVDGRFASTAAAVDLGSGNVKVLDLSTELVVLDWVYEPTVEYVAALITESSAKQEYDAIRSYSRKLGLTVLERIGFGPLSRPTFLRVGFRDICRDLDLHEGTSIRFVMGVGRLTRAYLDYDTCSLLFTTAFETADPQLEHALGVAFTEADIHREDPSSRTDAVSYHVRFPVPAGLGEARRVLGQMRRGLVALMARFEAERLSSIEALMNTFGARETLAGLQIREQSVSTVRILSPMAAGSDFIH